MWVVGGVDTLVAMGGVREGCFGALSPATTPACARHARMPFLPSVAPSASAKCFVTLRPSKIQQRQNATFVALTCSQNALTKQLVK